MAYELIRSFLEKIPAGLIAVGLLVYFGFGYYTFENDEASSKNLKQKELEAVKGSNDKLNKRTKELSEFVKTLEAKKVELRQLAHELQNIKGGLSESIDVSGFMKMVVTEANKVGLNVVSIKPGVSTNKEYYAEQSFNFAFKGIYFQVIAFLARISNLNQIVRIEKFSLSPASLSTARFVQLDGLAELKAYRYLGTKADNLHSTSGEGETKGPSETSGKDGL